LSKQETIGEEELLAEERIEEAAGETGISEKDINPRAASKTGPNKHVLPASKVRTWTDYAEAAARRLHPAKTTDTCSYGDIRARGPHLCLKAGLESRSCQENRYGRQAIHRKNAFV